MTATVNDAPELMGASWNVETFMLHAATADESTLRSILADLNTGGDTPIHDSLCPPEVTDRVLAALTKETSRGN